MPKERDKALFFAKKVKDDTNTLYAITSRVNLDDVINLSYVAYDGKGCNRHKFKIYTIGKSKLFINGKIQTTDNTVSILIPNFIVVIGDELDEMHSKCSLEFKKTFKLE